ncbi:TPA: helix-turn-helix domain-containing protein [Burkholderia vietnamiensis]|uniref:helix-turn-helix transcriptional regulator n=1 Tax=Burkholderia vietnamiensis TaxID=60552 RepID=UPI001592D09E|nr:helix-turn-helix domain-containing protein [Burkholderia vietnamiensis]HDR9016619.1 helix-turn-helix domain-containing protein [Burkholderia vietnamiensis]
MAVVSHELLLPPEVAEFIRVSPSTLARMVKRREFAEPIRLSPRRIAFRRADVERWLTSREGRTQ